MLFATVNSVPRCIANSSASTLTCMGKGRKPLEPWQLEDAVRLKKLWLEKRPRVGDRPMTQDEFAYQHLGGTQGLFFQYTSGHIPLNLDAALKFAAGLQVRIADFSPTLAERLRQAASAQGLTAENSANNVSKRTPRRTELARHGRPIAVRGTLRRSKRDTKEK